MFPPLPHRDDDLEPDPKAPSLPSLIVGGSDDDLEDLLEETAGAQGLDPKALIGFWALVALGLLVTSALIGAVLYGIEGAFGCLIIALLALPGLVVAMLLGLLFGGATSRLLAASAGAASCLAAVYRLGDVGAWECRLAVAAAAVFREHLARAHAVPRLRLTIFGLMARTLYVALAAIAWANYSGGS